MTRKTLAFGLISLVLLAGCEKLSSEFQSAPIKATTIEGKVRTARGGGEEVRVWRDPETGCEYLLWEGKRKGSMTPRLTSDGRPMCKS